MSARPIRWLLAAAALLPAAPARAVDVAVLSWTQSSAQGARTLRIPRTGTFDMPSVSSGYMVVAMAISDVDYAVESATWHATIPQGTTTQSFRMASGRAVPDPPSCRTMLWALSSPVSGPGYVDVTVSSSQSGSAMPSLAGAIIAFANVGATSTAGDCCVNIANTGAGTTTINKTVADTSRGDALVNAVCTRWTGAAPGTPGPDPANDPEMVPRTFQVIAAADMQQFTGTSPGADVDPPATKYRHMRWLQSGTRSWAITGLLLHPTQLAAPLPDAAAPPLPDAAPAVVDAARPPLDAAIAPGDDVAPAPPPDATAPVPDAEPPQDRTAAPPYDAGGSPVFPAPHAIDAEAPQSREDADRGPNQVAFQVGCACRLADPAPGGNYVLLLIAPLLRRRRPRR